MSRSVTWLTALRISWCPSICSEVKFPSRHVFRMTLQWVCEVFNLWRAGCETLTLCQLVSFLRRTFLPRCLQSRGIFLFTSSDCWSSRFRIFIPMAFLLTESCCCIFFQICSKSPGVFPYSESDGYRGSLKTSTCQPPLPFPCSSDSCVTQMLALCLFMPSRFLIGTNLLRLFQYKHRWRQSFVFLLVQLESPGSFNTWRLLKMI